MCYFFFRYNEIKRVRHVPSQPPKKRVQSYKKQDFSLTCTCERSIHVGPEGTTKTYVINRAGIDLGIYLVNTIT